MSAKAKQPGPGELEAFVNKLVTRDGDIRDEFLRIEKNRKHRAYMKKKRAGKGKEPTKSSRRMTPEEVERGVDARMGNMILRNGACSTCQVRAISGGDCDLAQLARAEDQCIHCYRRSRARQPAAEESHTSHTSFLIDRYGRCPKCKTHAIAGGISKPSVRAREAGLCLYCHRASKARKTVKGGRRGRST